MMDSNRETTELLPKGFINIDLVNKETGQIEKSLFLENFITNWGVESLANQIINPQDKYIIDKLYYGDGYNGNEPDIKIVKLLNSRGEAPLKNHVVQTILRASLTMLFRIDGDDISNPIFINEIGIAMKSNKLFSYRGLVGDEVLLLEPGKRINVTWSYRWR